MEASRNPQTLSFGRRRCPHSCREIRRISLGPQSAVTRGTGDPGAPSSPRLRSRCCLRRRGKIGAQAGPDWARWFSSGAPQTVAPQRSPLFPDLAGSKRPWHLSNNPGRHADGRNRKGSKWGVRVSLAGSWVMVWRDSESISLGAPSGSHTPYLLRLAPGHSPGGGNSRVPGSAAGGNCEPSCS